ncbi:MAG: hypothetical protein JO108_18740 [Acidobacteriaceae bacterium]|nr:hypothetical protein [Acidobacteriaceae bacterium]
MKDYLTQDKYTYGQSPTLMNLKDIKDGEKLEQFEANAVFFRSTQLLLRPTLGRFGLKDLNDIHRFLFQDVYAWTGELRTCKYQQRLQHFRFRTIH